MINDVPKMTANSFRSQNGLKKKIHTEIYTETDIDMQIKIKIIFENYQPESRE